MILARNKKENKRKKKELLRDKCGDKKHHKPSTDPPINF
jgi:hypothetical protein